LQIGYSIPFLDLWTGKRIWRGLVYALLMLLAKLSAAFCIVVRDAYALPRPTDPTSGWIKRILNAITPRVPNGDTLAPAGLLGLALVARGEIGVLIATVASSPPHDVLGAEAYLEAIWAILLCTILGPLAVGILARHQGDRIMKGPWGTMERMDSERY
jgi:hypothetical protein